MSEAVAAFDFDGTLTRRDSLVPFLARVAGWRRLLAATAREIGPLGSAALRLGSRDEAKARLLRHVFTGRAAAPIRVAGSAYGEHLVRTELRSDSVARLEWHRSRGDHVVIVSASLDVYLQTVATRLRLSGLLCTALSVDEHDVLTGELEGRNCRGPEKALRLRRWLDENDLSRSDVWAYGDSDGDRQLLDASDHGFLVRRGRIVDA